MYYTRMFMYKLIRTIGHTSTQVFLGATDCNFENFII